MLPRPTNDLKDSSVLAHIAHIQQEAMGNMITLSAAPSSTAPLLQDNEVGNYGNDIYWRIGNTIHKFSSDSQITVA